jgi:hypothetical protein
LDAHAYAGDALDRAPALLAEQVEANDAVGVDVGMHGDRAIGLLVEGDLGRFWGRSLSAGVGKIIAMARVTHRWDTSSGSGTSAGKRALGREGCYPGLGCRETSRQRRCPRDLVARYPEACSPSSSAKYHTESAQPFFIHQGLRSMQAYLNKLLEQPSVPRRSSHLPRLVFRFARPCLFSDSASNSFEICQCRAAAVGVKGRWCRMQVCCGCGRIGEG